MLVVGICLSVRNIALHQLVMTQFKHIKMSGVDVWRYTERFGSRTGSYKLARGVWLASKYKPATIDIYSFYVLDGAQQKGLFCCGMIYLIHSRNRRLAGLIILHGQRKFLKKGMLFCYERSKIWYYPPWDLWIFHKRAITRISRVLYRNKRGVLYRTPFYICKIVTGII